MNLREVIEEYISTRVNTKKEQETVKKLLLVDLDKYLKEENIPFEIDIKSLQANKNFSKGITDATYSLLIYTTKNKIKTQERILRFLEFLKKKYGLELGIDDVFKSEAIESYERKIDLLKKLNEEKTLDELLEYYYISSRPIKDDIRELVSGTKILGQEVKIREIETEKGKLKYQSSIHPIFLPLNLTEVFYLLDGLKTLAKDNSGFTGQRYNHLANRVYCQLSNYAKGKIDLKLEDRSYSFLLEDECERYNRSIDEEVMSEESKMSKLMYLYKSGTMCDIKMKTGVEYTNCNIKLSMDESKIYLICNEESIELDSNDIDSVEYLYI